MSLGQKGSLLVAKVKFSPLARRYTDYIKKIALIIKAILFSLILLIFDSEKVFIDPVLKRVLSFV